MTFNVKTSFPLSLRRVCEEQPEHLRSVSLSVWRQHFEYESAAEGRSTDQRDKPGGTGRVDSDWSEDHRVTCLWVITRMQALGVGSGWFQEGGVQLLISVVDEPMHH